MNQQKPSTLDLVGTGDTVLIRSVSNTESIVFRKLLSMGLTEGRSVTVLRKAPFGDPIAISALGFTLSLRLSEARLIEVEPSLAEVSNLEL
jgi:ferrous iron transport protein A